MTTTTAADLALDASLAYAAHRVAAEEAAQAFHYWDGVRAADIAIRQALGDAFWDRTGPYTEVRGALDAVWQAALDRSRKTTAAATEAYEAFQRASEAAKRAAA